MYNFGRVMTEEDKKLLKTFETKLRHLMYLHEEAKRENTEIKQLLREKEKELERLIHNYKNLEANYANLKLAKAISLDDNEIKDTKQRLSKLVREVDKCIALLNE